MREYKRLQRSNDQSPGYGMSRAYLETLADLPWSALASQRAAPRAEDASGTANTAEPADDGDSADAESGSSPDTADEGDSAGTVSASVPSTTAGEFVDMPLRAPAMSPSCQVPWQQIPMTSEASTACTAYRDLRVDEIAPSRAEMSLTAARALLDQQHYGLDKVKRRIVQYLAVRRLRGADARAPILCFIGPPGVGKTSLARSVAEVSLNCYIPNPMACTQPAHACWSRSAILIGVDTPKRGNCTGRSCVCTRSYCMVVLCFRCFSGPSSASHSAACVMKPRSVAIAGRMSARCLGVSSRCAAPRDAGASLSANALCRPRCLRRSCKIHWTLYRHVAQLCWRMYICGASCNHHAVAVQALRRAGVRDPTLLLDEVDKMGADSVRGDPAAALLEVRTVHWCVIHERRQHTCDVVMQQCGRQRAADGLAEVDDNHCRCWTQSRTALLSTHTLACHSTSARSSL